MPSLFNPREAPEESKKADSNLKRMVKELMESSEEGYLNEWEDDFILKMSEKIGNGEILSPNMINKIKSVHEQVQGRIEARETGPDYSDIF